MSEDIRRRVQELSSRIGVIVTEFSDAVLQDSASENPSREQHDKEQLKRLCRTLIAQRKRRNDHFPMTLFHEPAWEILMALYVAHVDKTVLYVKSLVNGTDAPVATSQRWIEHLANLKFVDRREDPADRRRIEVSMSAEGVAAMEKYLAAISA